MPVALADRCPPIGPGRQRVRLHHAIPCAQTHRSAHLLHADQLAQLVDDAMRCRRIELARVRLCQSTHIPRKLDARRLHPQADPEVRHLVLSRILDRIQHAFDAALAEPARHQNSVEARKLRLIPFRLEPLGLHPRDFEFEVGIQSAMHQRLLERLIAVLIFHILPDDADLHLILRVVRAAHDVLPLGHIGLLRLQPQILHRQRVHAFLVEVQRHLIDRGHIARYDRSRLFHVAERGNLLSHLEWHRTVCAAQQNVRLNTNAQHLLHRVLRRLGLQLLRCGDPRNQRHVNEAGVVAPQFLAHLANRLEEGKRLDIAHRSTDLDDRHVTIRRRHLAHRTLDLIRDVRNHLHRLAQVIAAPLLGDDLLVDTAGREVVIARELGMRKPLIVPEVEIGLRAVVGHKDLAVLKRAHRPRIDVQIRIELHQVDAQAARLQQAADRGCSQPFA